jgi:hypothetical protein
MVRAADNRAKAWELKKQGWTHAAIAKELGVSEPAVGKYIARGVQDISRVADDHRDEWRETQLARLEKLYERLEKIAAGDDDNAVIKAAAPLVKALERQAKLLGLDAPARHELTGKDGVPFNADPELQALWLKAESGDPAASMLLNVMSAINCLGKIVQSVESVPEDRRPELIEAATAIVQKLGGG